MPMGEFLRGWKISLRWEQQVLKMPTSQWSRRKKPKLPKTRVRLKMFDDLGALEKRLIATPD